MLFVTNGQAAFRGVVARKMLAVEAEKRAVAEAAKKEMAATRLVVKYTYRVQRRFGLCGLTLATRN